MKAFQNVLNVSQVKKCLAEHDVTVTTIPHDLNLHLTLEAPPVQNLDMMETQTRKKVIKMVLIRWECNGSMERT